MPVLLFVCTANLYRSPIAEAIFADLLAKLSPSEEWRVESAGIIAPDGLPIAPHALSALQERGIDASSHRTRLLTRDMLEGADLVLVMEMQHKEGLRLQHPDLAQRIVLLSEMVGLSYNLSDPDHDSLSSIQATTREIESLLKRGWARIQQLVKHA
jgi:protein-tyrosine-phosphatase